MRTERNQTNELNQNSNFTDQSRNQIVNLLVPRLLHENFRSGIGFFWHWWLNRVFFFRSQAYLLSFIESRSRFPRVFFSAGKFKSFGKVTPTLIDESLSQLFASLPLSSNARGELKKSDAFDAFLFFSRIWEKKAAPSSLYQNSFAERQWQSYGKTPSAFWRKQVHLTCFGWTFLILRSFWQIVVQVVAFLPITLVMRIFMFENLVCQIWMLLFVRST